MESHAILRIPQDILPEVVYLQEARKLKRGPNWSADLRDLLDRYRASRALIEPFHIDQTKEEDVFEITDMHCVVEAFTKEFCNKILPTGRKILPTSGKKKYPPLSKSETRRIHRAIYRFEIFGELFGVLPFNSDPDWSKGDDFSAELFAELFFSTFEAWEVEEIACIRDFLFEFYRHAIEECMPEIANLDRIEEMGCLGFNDPTCNNFQTPRVAGPWIDEDAERFLVSGLEWFMNTMMATACAATRARSMLEDHLLGGEMGYDFLTEALKVIPGDWYPTNRKTPKIKERDWSEDGANAGWHWSTKNLDEEYFDSRKAALREQGYVMWDLSRLRSWHSLRSAFKSSIQNEKSIRSTFLGRRR